MEQAEEMRAEQSCSAPTLRARYSIEVTAKDREGIGALDEILAAESHVSVTFLPGETLEDRIATAQAVRAAGFVPVPHISARRLQSKSELETFLGRLEALGASERVFVIAGDLPEPAGPFRDTLSVIESGVLPRYGVKHVGIAGHPQGHPEVAEEDLWQALTDKTMALGANGLTSEIVTQFGFDAEVFLSWIDQVRCKGMPQLIKVGVPGPASLGKLLKFAARCGVGTSARMMSRYGTSITKLMTTATPERMLNALEAGYRADRHGEVAYHLYPFGGLKQTVQWMENYEQR